MMKVALTGGIATGKSYVLARLKSRGVPTLDADDVVHAALSADTPTTRAIAAQLGGAFLRPDGSVDRAVLAATVFAQPDARLQLEAIVHPVVYEAIQTWFETPGGAMGVASIPLLYETGREHDFDFVAVTLCPPTTQLRRLIERDRMSENEARQRIAAQMAADEKAARGNFVIQTGGTTLETDRQVDELLVVLNRITTGS